MWMCFFSTYYVYGVWCVPMGKYTVYTLQCAVCSGSR